jgi:predicted Zn-dependent protease
MGRASGQSSRATPLRAREEPLVIPVTGADLDRTISRLGAASAPYFRAGGPLMPQAVLSNLLPAAQHLHRAAAGLDLYERDDRASFRERLAQRYDRTKLSAIRRQARADGIDLTGKLSRAAVVRAIADAYLRERGALPR